MRRPFQKRSVTLSIRLNFNELRLFTDSQASTTVTKERLSNLKICAVVRSGLLPSRSSVSYPEAYSGRNLPGRRGFFHGEQNPQHHSRRHGKRELSMR